MNEFADAIKAIPPLFAIFMNKNNKFLFIFSLLSIFVLCNLLIYLCTNKTMSIDEYFQKNYSDSLKKAIKNGYYVKELMPLDNATFEEKKKILESDSLKKLQCKDIDFLIYTSDFIKDSEDFDIYHFINHPCPTGTMRIAELKDANDEKEKKIIATERQQIINANKNKQSANGRIRRREDFNRILNYKTYRLYSRYTNKQKFTNKTCNGLFSLRKNEEIFKDTLFSKKVENLDIHEGTYYILHDKVNKVYHTFKLYTSQNENPNIPFIKYEIFYQKITDEIDFDFEIFFLLKEFNVILK